ncbi:hypothetical protein VULLAG_LOCUS15556 [Vulpes lagopus]
MVSGPLEPRLELGASATRVCPPKPCLGVHGLRRWLAACSFSSGTSVVLRKPLAGQLQAQLSTVSALSWEQHDALH